MFLKPWRGFATTAIHSNVDPDQWSGAIVPPIVTSTIYKDENDKGYVYSRAGNPSRQALEECLAKLDGGKHAMAFASGVGAITTISSMLCSGDHIISSDDVYGGSSQLFREIVAKLGIEITFVDCTIPHNLAKAIQKNTRMVFLETPTNPLLKVLDITGICQLVKSFGSILVVVDNTFLTPYLQRPLDFGADIVMYSLTKYMNGHSDVVMGATIVNDENVASRLRFLQEALGNVPSPIDCYLLCRSLKTLSLRMEQHNNSALIIAQWLQNHTKIKEVMHPGLPSHPHYEITRKQTSGHSGVFSFRHFGGLRESRAFLNSLKIFTVAQSLGGFESLAQIPATMTHVTVPAEHRLKLGITEELIRLSVGLEDVEDLIEDIEQALNVAFPYAPDTPAS